MNKTACSSGARKNTKQAKEIKVLLKEEYGEQNVSQDRHESHVVYVALN